tara:strand:+ start:297 stop:554 length:258 start_codon:yes stop_codon:yes gene_type:complete
MDNRPLGPILSKSIKGCFEQWVPSPGSHWPLVRGVRMRRESLASDEIAADKMVVAAALTLLMISAVSVIVLLSTDEGENPASSDW